MTGNRLRGGPSNTAGVLNFEPVRTLSAPAAGGRPMCRADELSETHAMKLTALTALAVLAGAMLITPAARAQGDKPGAPPAAPKTEQPAAPKAPAPKTDAPA